jgi:hypothetical protein
LQLVGDHRDLLFSTLMLFRYVYPQATNFVPRGIWQMVAAELGQSPNGQPQFRGTLLDENMFAIDVKDWGLPDPLAESRKKKTEIIHDLRGAA